MMYMYMCRSMKYDVQIDAEIRKVAPYTDPLKHPKKCEHVYRSVNMFTLPWLKHLGAARRRANVQDPAISLSLPSLARGEPGVVIQSVPPVSAPALAADAAAFSLHFGPTKAQSLVSVMSRDVVSACATATTAIIRTAVKEATAIYSLWSAVGDRNASQELRQ
jgi:hypothetical protein